MNYYILLEEWSSGVRKFKDEERGDTKTAEEVALFVLDYIRYTRFRQYNLFTQKRGEEFERMIEQAEKKELPVEMLRRFIEEDGRWKTTLELADQ
jgi:hypothetical protein